MMRYLLLVLLLTSAAHATEEYQGYIGRWVNIEATAYSPYDKRDASYHAKKGADRWMTAGRVSDVRRAPFGVAAPQSYTKARLASSLCIPLRTRIIVPLGNGYLDHEWKYDEPHERVFLVDDTGADIIKDTKSSGLIHIDLRMKTEADAFAYGRKRFRIFIIEREAPKLPPPVFPEPPTTSTPVHSPAPPTTPAPPPTPPSAQRVFDPSPLDEGPTGAIVVAIEIAAILSILAVVIGWFIVCWRFPCQVR